MPLLENKKYVLCKIDNREYCIINGQFNRFLSSQNLSLPQYLEKYEGIKCRCLYCDDYSGMRTGFVPKDTCGKRECARAATNAGFTPEVCSKMSSIAKKLFSNEDFKRRNQAATRHGNLKIGKDGLTGYERTAIKRRETLLAKYGNEYYSNNAKTRETWANKSDQEKDEYANKISKTQLAFSPEKKKKIIDKIVNSHLSKYGVACPANLHPQFGSSKIASLLFASLNCEDAELKPKTKERSIERALADFCFGGKVIEFYGDYWHANPFKFKPDDIVGKGKWPAKDVWQKDAERIKKIQDAGYEVKIIWERDFKRNPEQVIKDCKEWLSNT